MVRFLSFMLTLCMLVTLSACGGGVAQEEYDALVTENAELKQRNEELTASLAEYVDMAAAQAENNGMFFDSAAKALSENATSVQLSEDYVQITVPLEGRTAEEIKALIEENAMVITACFLLTDYKACFITVVDENNDCYIGYAIKPDGTSSVYAGESFFD